MSSVAVASRSNRAFRFFDATIVKKAAVAVTGIILFGFIVGHLLGNLQVFGPNAREHLDAYSALLKRSTPLLWGVRIILLVSVGLHILATIQLWKLKNQARPVSYSKKNNAHSSFASRTMYYSGPMIALFVIYHLLHLTAGKVGPHFTEGEVYNNLVYGFEQPIISIVYVLAVGFLMLHLYHGLYSMFQTLGIAHPKYTLRIRKAAAAIAIALFVGYASIPLAVLAGIVHL